MRADCHAKQRDEQDDQPGRAAQKQDRQRDAKQGKDANRHRAAGKADFDRGEDHAPDNLHDANGAAGQRRAARLNLDADQQRNEMDAHG